MNVDLTLVVQLLFTESPVGQTGFICLLKKKSDTFLFVFATVFIGDLILDSSETFFFPFVLKIHYKTVVNHCDTETNICLNNHYATHYHL